MLFILTFTSQPSKVVDLVRKDCDKNISTQFWVICKNHVVEEEENICMLDHVQDNEIDPFIIHLYERW